MNPFFSPKEVQQLEPLFTEKKTKVNEIMDGAARTGAVLNVSDAYFAYSNDIVRAYSFGSDNGLLDNLAEANRQRNNLTRLLTGINMQRHFPTLFRMMGQVMPMILGPAAVPSGVMDVVHFKQTIYQDISAVLADTDNTKKGQHSVFHELRDSTILPKEEKTAKRLQDEATLLVMAGTESTAKSLGIATFYLLENPKLLDKLRVEVQAARKQSDRNIALSDLLRLPYLSAVIIEANRLSFGVTNRMNRYSPDETLSYTASYGPHKGKTYVLPPRTMMSTLTYCTLTDESLYPNPFRFDPDRWIVNAAVPGQSEAEVNYRKRCMHALGKGHRRCIGVNVANAALSVVLADLVNYDFTLYETDELDVKFQYDFQISHPRPDSRGIRVKVNGFHND